MGKKGVATETLVGVVAIVVVLLIFLLIIPNFQTIFSDIAKKGGCQWSLLAHSLTKTPGLGFVTMPAECKAINLEINLENLSKDFSAAKRRIAEYSANDENKQKYSEIIKSFPVNPTEDKLYEWAIDKVIAEQMKSCWDKVWKGQMSLFDEWWNLFDSPALNYIGITATDQYAKMGSEDRANQVLGSWNLGIVKIWGAPTTCVVCTRIKFSAEVQKKLPTHIESLNDWLRSNPVPYDSAGRSYYQYLIEGQTMTSGLIQPIYTFSIDTPYAIIYKRINPQKITALSSWVGNKLGLTEESPPVNLLRLVEYDKVTQPYADPYNGEGCFFVID